MKSSLPASRFLAFSGLLLILLISLFLSPARAGDGQVPTALLIEWLVPDYPPGYIASGPRAGQGQGDQVLAWFREHLPGYRHRIRRESMARTMSMLGSPRGDFCVPGFPYFPHLRETMVAGEVIGVVPPLRLITLETSLEQLPVRDDAVSLAELLANPALTVALVEGRDYLDLEPLLDAHRRQANVLEVSPGNMVGSLFGLLFTGRVDYLVEHGFMLPYVRSLDAERGRTLRMLRIREASRPVDLHPMCRDNPGGREVVRRLNELTATPEFRRMMDESFRKLLPEAERAEFGKLIDQVRAEPAEQP